MLTTALTVNLPATRSWSLTAGQAAVAYGKRDDRAHLWSRAARAITNHVLALVETQKEQLRPGSLALLSPSAIPAPILQR